MNPQEKSPAGRHTPLQKSAHDQALPLASPRCPGVRAHAQSPKNLLRPTKDVAPVGLGIDENIVRNTCKFEAQLGFDSEVYKATDLPQPRQQAQALRGKVDLQIVRPVFHTALHTELPA